MINIGKILKRSWEILWSYKVLWIFGILLAITGTGNGGGSSGSGIRFGNDTSSSNGGSNYNPNFQPGTFLQELNDWFVHNINPLFDNPSAHISTFIWIGVGILVFVLVVGIITSIFRYVSENAVIRLVDEFEQTGVKVGFKQGWKTGWNRRAFRMWVIDLVISVPVMLLVALLVGLGFLLYFSISRGSSGLAVGGTVAAIGCAFLFIFAFILLMVFLGLLRQFFVRSAALDETSIRDSFRQGWGMFKRNWKSAALMWLVMLGIGIGYGIVGLIAFVLLIPAYLVMAIPAVLVAAIPAAIAFGITSLFASAPLAWILAAVVAIPIFFLVMLAPLSLVNGWYALFTSNAWTLTYREMKALEAVKPEELPTPVA